MASSKSARAKAKLKAKQVKRAARRQGMLRKKRHGGRLLGRRKGIVT